MPTPTILHFSTGRYFRGGERQVEFLHAGLSGAGMQSILVCRKGGGLINRNLANVIPLPWRGEWDALGLARFVRICKQHRPAIIHSHDGHSLAHASIAGALTGAVVIHTRRVNFPLGRSAFSRWKYARCSALIGVSEAVARACKEAFPSVRVHTVHDGVDWSAPGLARSDARQELGVGGEAFVIGAVAYFTEEKNLPLLASLARSLLRYLRRYCLRNELIASQLYPWKNNPIRPQQPIFRQTAFRQADKQQEFQNLSVTFQSFFLNLPTRATNMTGILLRRTTDNGPRTLLVP